jgi:hypothetical protein
MFILNRIITSALPDGVLPIERFTGQKAKMKNIRIFGTDLYIHQGNSNSLKSKKLLNRGIEGILLGYTENGYIIQREDNGKICRTRNVIFTESISEKTNYRSKPTTNNESDSDSSDSCEEDMVREEDNSSNYYDAHDNFSERMTSENEQSKEENFGEGGDEEYDHDEDTNEEFQRSRTPIRDGGACDKQIEDEPKAFKSSPKIVRSPVRKEKQSYFYKEVDSEEEENERKHGEVDKRNILKGSRRSYLTVARFGRKIHSSEVTIPQSYEEAINGPFDIEWKEAIKEEFKSTEQHDVFELKVGQRPKDTISTKWIFDLKTDNDGYVIRFKARLVARGFTQTYGVNYEDTYAPVPHLATIRLLFALAATERLEMYQYDVKTAF